MATVGNESSFLGSHLGALGFTSREIAVPSPAEQRNAARQPRKFLRDNNLLP